MKKVFLQDLGKWMELNKDNDFSVFDYIFKSLEKQKVSTDIFFAFLEMFWPSFHRYKGYVFLKENFSESKAKKLISKNERVEFWLNLFITDPFFENEEDGETRAKLLAKSLVKIWQAKLKNDFPEIKFIVKYIEDVENGDYGLTFHQDI